jgi:4-hydroxybenzoate polyprenyltransferase
MTVKRRTKARNFSFTGFLKLVRFSNLAIIVFTQYIAGIFMVGGANDLLYRITDPKLFLLSLSTVLIAAAGYIINDYYDVKIDIINKPHRVVVDRILKRRVAIVAHTILNIFGIGIGFTLSITIGLINVLSAFLLWFYSNQLKRLPLIGNIAIAMLTGTALAVLAVYYRENEKLIYTFSVFAFLITLIREILKDMQDIKGDASYGCKTLPIIWGIRKTKLLLYGLIAAFIATLFTLAGLLLTPQIAYLFFILLIPTSWLIIKLVRADTTKEFSYLSGLCKFIMIMGVLSMCLL